MLSALSLARAVENDDLTPEAVLDRVAERIAEREDDVLAFAHIDLDGARAALAGTAATPLRGLPVGVKDIFDTCDMPTRHGSAIYEDNRPAADASLVAAIRHAGGVVAAKTVTTEFAFFSPGPTRNPHDLGHTPGGSSSGSAAAIAAGMLPLAIGSQTGGSVIRPAAFCGIAGFKPTYDLLPTAGMKTFSWTLDTAGLFAADVDDVAFFAAALTGRDWRTDNRPRHAPRIKVVHSHLWQEADGSMRAAVEEAARRAGKAGARVRETELAGVFSDAFAAHTIIQDFEGAASLCFEADRYREMISPMLRETIDAGRAITPGDYDTARWKARLARGALDDLFDDCDVLLAPSAPGPAPEGLGSTGSSIFNRLWTLMEVPCVNVPGMVNPSGMPLGVQVIGLPGEDRETLRAAAWLQRQLK